MGMSSGIERVQNREALVAFIRELHKEFKLNGDQWENQNLEHFLESMAAWLDDYSGYCLHTGKDPEERPT